ncbi:solute carrier family 23 protein [Desulfosporosinus sp.]|uniref:uracil-xanthine permease family protein n=1 Tax=Desulfosporosinus sp. TaxID=157907 RepID=UPI000E93BC77|nr:solute carrier family 23 protein [Desulfosporosinus sp.]MBC2722748.1 purine/pyrimidine permease [Desulfosporosinus sp.]MBC2724925.1 purine/pyrimidine permease [Desulfosporosinus sp.]HBV87829.1 xanthine permease [Desulfosporosinus sp.]
MKFKYALNEIPPLGHLLLFSIQWLAIIAPIILIMGTAVTSLHPSGLSQQVVYIQKLFFVVAIALFSQVVWGHRLPIIIGPATVFLVGMAAGGKSNLEAVYTSIFLGGLLLTAISVTGLFAQLKKLFTSTVIAVILILVALTLTPMILNLITTPTTQASSFAHLCFSLVMIFSMFIAANYLRGLWKSTLIFWAILGGTLAHFLIFPQSLPSTYDLPTVATFWNGLRPSFVFDSGVFLSFLICFLALSVNDLGSIQSVDELIKPDNMEKRITRGVIVTGLINVLSGFLGVIGSVNFSFSSGVIIASGAASRYTLIPTSIGLLMLSFLPKTIAVLGSIPSVVIGSSMVYLMCSQIAGGLQVALSQNYKFNSGLIIGLPMILGVIISYLPPAVLNTFPPILRPVLGNGFVVGVIAVLIMEHIVFRRRD